MRDWRNEPMTREEQDAWDEHEAYLIAQGQQDRSAFLDSQRGMILLSLELNRAICAAIANQAPWED